MIKLKRSFVIFVVFLHVVFQLVGQQTYQLILDQSSAIPKGFTIKNQKIDSLELNRYLNRIYIDLYKRGFVTAKIDTSTIGKDSLLLAIKPGNQFKISSLGKGNLPDELLRKIDFNERYFLDKPFNYKAIASLLNKVLVYSESHGYAFAEVALDKVKLTDSNFSAELKYNQGPFITFDSLKIEGDVKIKPEFLAAYLKIYPGKPFDYQKIDQANKRLGNLRFLKPKERGYLTFQNNQASYHLDLAKRKANQVDGIIGFLPNEQEDGKLLVTGQFDLKLHNLFSSGKRLYFNWQRLKVLSQSLDIKYDHPSLFHAAVDVGIGFNLLKEDSSFLNRSFVLQINYDAGPKGRFNVFINDKTASNLRNFAPGISQLPELLDFDLTAYGVGYSWNNFTDVVDPRRGFEITINGHLGNKRIQQDPSIAPELFEQIALNSIQYQLDLSMVKYIEINQKWLFNINAKAGKIFNDQLFANDLYRIGGLRSLRGFNENFFFASAYAFTNFNMRYYIDEATYFLLFYDQSYIQNETINNRDADYPSGLGAGINLTTKSGVFSFIYALGRSKDQPLSFNLSKIHFGYTSRF